MTTVQNQILIRQDNIEAAELDGEWVLLDLETHTITKLNELGGTIWTLLETHRTVSALAEQVVAEYGIDRETAERDIESFVQELQGVGLLQYA